MANVLPPEIQDRTTRYENARLMIAGSVVAVIAAALSVLAFVPAYMAVQIEGDSSAENDVPRAAHIQSLTAELAGAQAVVNSVAPIVSATTTPSAALAAALALKPPTVSIDQIVYSPGVITLSGVARTDADIDAYRAAVAQDPRFTGVTVPVSALLGASGGSFSMQLSGAF